MESPHLADILANHNRTSNVQVVFFDVEKYSSRRTLNQIAVIDSVIESLAKALDAVGKHYLAYAQANNLNFKSDIICIPTGDGAAVVFSFDGLHDIHLLFAKHLHEAAWRQREAATCDVFNQEGWCNCHPYFNLRVGVSEGKAILFRDINGNYNCAGGVMNLASRAMGIGDRNQIIFTEEAYRQIIDMIPDPTFIKHFIEFKNVDIKHQGKINVYQYIGNGEAYLNGNPPEDLLLISRMREGMDKMRGLGLPMLDADAFDTFDKKKMAQFVENFAAAATGLKNALDVTTITSEKPQLSSGQEQRKKT